MEDEECEHESLTDVSESGENQAVLSSIRETLTPAEEVKPKPANVPKSLAELLLEKELEALDQLSDQDLINFIHDEEVELRHLSLENKSLLSYLKENDPSEVEDFDKIINSTIDRMREGHTASNPQKPVTRYQLNSMPNSRRTSRSGSMLSMNSFLDGKGPKINVSQKSDIVLKAMEELQASLQVFLRKCRKIRRNLKAELEEFSIQEKDIRQSLDSFEYDILVHAVDPLTQRIPAEKFIRWMDEWMKSAELNMEKLRLKTDSANHNLQLVSATLVQRKELRRNVHAVDFDQLQIENKNFLQKLDDMQYQLMEMKIMDSTANIGLNNMKYELRKQQEDYDQMKILIEEKAKKTQALEAQCTKFENSLVEARHCYFRFKELTKSYKVPDVMDYFKIKCDLHQLENEKKVWQRRKKIQDITINACLRQMKNMTGSPKIDRAWLNTTTIEHTLCNNDIEALEVEEWEGTSTTEWATEL